MGIEDTCWLVCQKHYVDQRPGKKVLSRKDIHKLWCVFNFVSESDAHDKPKIPIVAHRDEVELIVHKMLTSIGKLYDRDVFNDASNSMEEFTFEKYVDILEHTYLEALDKDAISCTITDIYQEYILQVLKKVSNLFDCCKHFECRCHAHCANSRIMFIRKAAL